MDEFEFIKKMSDGVPRTGDGLLQGIDDDAAVIEGPNGQCWLVTTDILAEGVHFKREWMDWKTIGAKALLVNISDIAAMGGTPRFYFASVAVPKDLKERDLMDFVEGMNEVAAETDMILAGGDTTASDAGFFVSLTVVGAAPHGQILYRKGARPGDKIYVSGSLGGSAAGLACLEKGLKEERFSHLVMRHMLPEPRLALGRWLAKNRCATSMIDVSDGLKADLDRIAELSRVGYKVYAEKVPVADGVGEVADRTGISRLDLAMAGGEDYELIFTMNTGQERQFADKKDFGCSVTQIGEILKDTKVRTILAPDGKGIKLASPGFVHRIGNE